jgi:enoyl-CoA hydratase
MSEDAGTHDEPAVLFRRETTLGRITLNRPRAINALNHSMVQDITRALDRWAQDDSVHAVVLQGAGDRGLCAGGDIRAIYLDAKNGGDETYKFWHDEYLLNSKIASYPKPFVAVMDGLVMGGGVGLSAHASHRLVTERSKVGMPEVKIGLVPDVGGTYLLARAPGRTGMHAALTGGTLSGADGLAMGLADRIVAHGQIEQVIDDVARDGADQAFAGLAASAESEIMAARTWIDECYQGDSVQQIRDQLAAHEHPDAQAAAKTIDAAAPLALTVTFEAMRLADRLPSLERALNQDYRMVYALFRAPDLTEGIRAQVIDKDRNPRWQPAQLADVTREMTAAYFANTPTLPFPSRETDDQAG